jgi:hypothetical protein
MKRKMRKFAEGGFSAAQEEWLGGADRTDPYILARMRRAVPDETTPKTTSRDFDAIDADMVAPSRDLTAPVTKTVTKTSVTATPKKAVGPTPESPEEYKTRMESLVKKQGLERVEPENYVPGPGLLKGMLKSVVNKGIKTIGREALPAPSTVKMLEDKATKMLPYDKAGSLAAKRAARAESRDIDMKMGNARNYGIDPSKPGSASALDALRKDIGAGEFTMKKGGKVKAYKAGGTVKSSASKRADGCAIRGKTRA